MPVVQYARWAMTAATIHYIMYREEVSQLGDEGLSFDDVCILCRLAVAFDPAAHRMPRATAALAPPLGFIKLRGDPCDEGGHGRASGGGGGV